MQQQANQPQTIPELVTVGLVASGVAEHGVLFARRYGLGYPWASLSPARLASSIRRVAENLSGGRLVSWAQMGQESAGVIVVFNNSMSAIARTTELCLRGSASPAAPAPA